MAIPLKECVFCEKKWLLRDIDVDMSLIGQNTSRLDRGVCRTCSEELWELPLVEFQNLFSYNKMVRISDLGDGREHLRIKFHIQKEKELVIEEIFEADFGMKPKFVNQFKRTFPRSDFIRFQQQFVPPLLRQVGHLALHRDDYVPPGDVEPEQLKEKISDFFDSLVPDSKTRLGVRALYRINLECVIGEKCDSKSSVFIYLGEGGDNYGEFYLEDEFPQEHRIQEIICCGEKQIRRFSDSPFFCENSHASEHRCACKERDVHDDVKEAWRTYKKGHVNRGQPRRRRERAMFISACREHDEDEYEMEKILESRYRNGWHHGGQAAGSYTIAGSWREEEDFDCAELEECAISPTTRVFSVDIPGMMTGSGYICSECYGE